MNSKIQNRNWSKKPPTEKDKGKLFLIRRKKTDQTDNPGAYKRQYIYTVGEVLECWNYNWSPEPFMFVSDQHEYTLDELQLWNDCEFCNITHLK